MSVFEAVSRKWCREILESLSLGAKRYNELRQALAPGKPGLSTRTLSDRLRDLEGEGLIARKVESAWPPTTTYAITPRGKKVLTLIAEMEEAS
jgi:DNA-binding HxlR family transcriptional regulator